MNWHIAYGCFCAADAELSSICERPYGPQNLENVLSSP